MNRNNLIILTDLALIPSFFLSACTGLQLHLAGHMETMDLWHRTAALHTLFSLIFLVLALLHVFTHKAWYRNLPLHHMGKCTMVVLLTVIFAMTILSGVYALASDITRVGILHYKTGIFLTILGILHIIKRLRILKGFISRLITTKRRGDN